MGIFDTLNKNIGALGMPGGLGLMTTGLGLLEGESPLKAVQAGLGTFGTLQDEEERRRRLGAIAKLGEQYAGDPRLKAIIDADPQAGLSLIAQLEAQRRRPRTPTTLQQRKNLAAELGFAPDSAEYRRILETGSTAAAPITTAKDADGFLRNVATGERVFPDATGKVTPPKYREFDGDLYQETANGLSLVKKGTDEVKFTTLGDKVYRQDGTNLVEVIDDSTPPAPVLREVDGTLYNVTDPANPVEVIKGAKDPNTATIGGALYDITDIKNPTLVIAAPTQAQTELAKLKQDLDNNLITQETYNDRVAKLATTPPQSAKTQNYTAGKDFTLNGRTIKAGQTFALNLNNIDDVAIALTDGEAIEAPTRTESTVTNTSADAVVPTGSVADSPVSTIDINTAAGGDVAGVATDILNKSLGFVFGSSFNPERTDAKANLAALENAVLPGLVKSISTTGAVRSQQDAKRLIPAAGDTNPEMRAKIDRLVPVLKAKLVEAVNAQKQEKLTPTQRTVAQQVISTYPNLIATLEETLKEYDDAGITAAGSSVFSTADSIVERK